MNEVVATIMGLNGEGALVADAFLVLFFSRFWEMVKTGVIAAMEEFRGGNFGTERINRSYLFLLP